MAQYLTVRHRVEIPLYNIVGVPALTFRSWFPLENEDKIVISHSEYDIELWFDDSCLHDSQRNEDLSMRARRRNVLCKKIIVDVTIKKVSQELISFLKRNIRTKVEKNEILEKEAQKLGELVYHLCSRTVNRLINYSRYIKGQYWLDELAEDKDRISDFNAQSNTKATDNIEDEESWFQWRPIHYGTIYIPYQSDEEYISKEDWKFIKEFVNSENRIDFSLELLSRAKVLRSFGYGNNAVIDSIIALEIALNEFSKKPNREKLIEAGMSIEIELSSLDKTIAHLGFTASVNYLLPLILPKDLVNKDTFQSVNEIISIRQNIIHNGQKKVHKDKFKLMSASEKLTKLLINLTLK